MRLFSKSTILLAIVLLHTCLLFGATITSTTTGGDWSLGSTWVGGVAPISTDDVVIATTGGNVVTLSTGVSCVSLTINTGAVLTPGANLLTISGDFVNLGTLTSGSGGMTLSGTANQNIAGFTTTGTVSMIKTGGTATFTGNVNGAGLTINGIGGTLSLGAGRTHTFTGTWTRTNGTLDGASSTINFSNATVASGTGGTFTASTGTVNFSGTTQTCPPLTYNNLTVSNSGVKTFATTPAVNGILSMEGTATITVTTGVVTYGANATLQYNTSTSRTTSDEEWVSPFTGTGGVIIANIGVIIMNAAKVLNTDVPLTINSGASLTANTLLLTLGGNFTRNGTFTSTTGGVTLAGTGTQSISGFTTTGTVTMTKTAGVATLSGNLSCADITLNGVGGTLSFGSANIHTISGNLTITNGTLDANSSNVTLTGTTTQSIAGFTTTGTFTSSKGNNSTATLTGNLNAAALTISNGATNSILSLGTGLTHTITGTLTRTSGTLQGGSSTLNIGGDVSGTGGAFTAGTGTVNYNGTAQTCAVVTYNNLTLANSGVKTFVTTPTVNGILTLEGDATITVTTGVVTYGANATLRYNTSIARNASAEEWITPFAATGGVIISNTGAISLTAARTFNANIPLTINSGATLTPGANLLTFGGDFINSGTLTSGSGGVTISGTATTQNIGTFTTTGTVTLTKTAGTATFTGNVNGGAFTLNGSGGTLNLGTGLNHTFTGTWTRTNGTLNGGSSTISFSVGGTVISGAGGTFTPNAGTVNYSGTAQTIGSFTYNNLTLSGSGTKTTTGVTVNGVLSLEGTATVSAAITYGSDATLQYNKPASFTSTNNEFPATFSGTGGVIITNTGTITFNAQKIIIYTLNIQTGATVNFNGVTTHTANGLMLGGVSQSVGSYGGTGSGATNINATFFGAFSGFITISSSATLWTAGALTTDWSTAGNWSNGVPTSSLDATIPNIALQPTLTADAVCRNLTINSGATLTSASFQLTIHGSFVQNGTATFGSSPIVIAGIINQSIAGLTTTGNITMTKTAATATFTGNISAASIILNGSGGTLNFGASFSHSISGNLTITAGTLNANSSQLNLTGTATQSIAGFTTTGNLVMNKTGGVATLTGNVNGANLTIDGVGGTLNLGTGLSHVFTGTWNSNNGTLEGGSSTISFSNATVFSGSGGTFTSNTGTVNFSGTAQTCPVLTFNNLTLSNSGVKTFATAPTVNGILSLQGTATVVVTTGVVTYGSGASLQYNTTTARTVTDEEWVSPFTASGGVTIASTGAISLNGAKIFNAAVPLTINSGATLTPGANLITTSGNFSNSGTLTSGAGGMTITGTEATQSISGFTTTGNINMTKTAGTATFTGNISAASLILNGLGGTLNLGAARTHTFTGNITVTNGTLVGNTSNVTITGTATQSIDGFTTTGNISMTKTGGVATLNGNINANGLTINGTGGTLNAGTGLTHVFTGTWTRTNGTLNGGSSTISFSLNGTVISGSGGTFTPGTGTINYSGAAQTVGALTYNNLTLSGSGVKTTTGVTVNGILSLEGTASVSAVITYGGDATLRYNTGNAVTTTNNEFPASFVSSGGVIVNGSGTVVTFNGAKDISENLTINTGAQINLSTFSSISRGLVLGGVTQLIGFYGGTASGAANIDDVFFESTSTGTLQNRNKLTTWSGGSSTDWSDPLNWNNGVPTSTLDVLIPNVATQPTLTVASESGDLTINSGATLTSAGFQLSIHGNFTNNGTANLSSSPIVITGIFAQTIGGFTTTGNVSMTKTGGTATLSGNLSCNSLILNGTGGTLNLGPALTHTFTGDITITAGTLVASSSNIVVTGTGTQSIATLNTTGNFSMTKTGGTATLSGNLNVNTITVNGSGGTLNLGAGTTHTITGDITLTAGTLTGNSANIILSGTSTQSIAGFTTTGNLTTTKTGGTATLTGALSVNTLTINGTGGTLNLGTSLSHVITGNITVTVGTLNGGSSTVELSGNLTGTFTAGAANVTLAGTGTQSIAGFTTTGNVLMTKTGGTATFTGNISVASLTLNGSGGTLNLGLARTHTFTGDIVVTAGTLTGSTSNVTISGTATQSIAGFTITGTLSMTKTGGTATLTGNMNAGALTINGSGGTLHLGTGLVHTFTGTWTRTSGTLNGGTSTLTLSGSGAVVSGSGGTFTPSTGTVNYSGAAQTVGQLTYNNLTLSGSGVKTTTSVTVNGILSLEGTATVSTAPTYGSAATLSYNKPSAFTTTNNEFPASFTSSGGVVIAGAGTITFNASKSISFSLIINSGSTVDLNGITTHTCTGITLNGVPQVDLGTWGGTGSGASNINATFFGTFAGRITLNNPSTVWTAGASTTDWFTAGNWSNGVPTALLDVEIPNIATQPILTNDAVCRALTVNLGATLTSANFQLTIHGSFTRNGTVVLGSSPIVITGTLSQNISGFTTTGTVSLTKTGGTATLTSDLSAGGIVVNGSGGTLNLGTALTHTISGDITVTAGTLTGSSANITLSGTSNQNIDGFTTTGNVSMTKTGGTATLTGNLSVNTITVNGTGGTLNLGAGRTHTITGDIVLTAGTLTGNSANIILTGTGTQNIAGLTTTGSLSVTKTGGTATFTGNFSGAALTMNGVGGTLNLGTSRTHTFSGTVTRTNGTLDCSSSILNLSAATPITGTGGTFTIGTSTINFSGAAQTCPVFTFNNLTLSGSGVKTFATTPTVNGTLSMQGTATVTVTTGVVTYGASASLQYSTTTSRTVSDEEWITPFTATGGVTIASTGAISLNAAKTFNAGATLTINSGATLTPGSNLITLNGDLVNSGTVTSGSGGLTIEGTATQNIGAFTTTGTVSMTKTSGTATFTGNINGGALTINGSGGTLNLGTGRTHTFTGIVSLTSGTLNGGSSIINVNATSVSAWNGTGSNFVASTGTVRFGGAAQTIATSTTFNNLSITAVGAKTISANITVSGALSFTAGTLAIGSNTLILNGSVSGMSGTNCFTANGSSNITIGGTGSMGGSLFFDQTTPGTTNRLSNFTYNRASQTITLGNAVQVTTTVTPTAGTLATGGFLTLISDATATACITAGTGSYISGNVTVQRFIPSVARRFRFMSSPSSSSTIDDWRGEFFVTGTGGASNGFDATTSNPSTVFSYNEATSGSSSLGWTGATNVTNTLDVGRGYRVFIRGDRSNTNRLNDTEPTQNAVTANVVGAVNRGDIVMPITFTNTGSGGNDGWNLLGNPYPCHYNWNTFFDDGTNLTNVDPTIFIYDPNTNNYKSFNASSNVGDISGGIIPSGSAFFVHANAASPAITFRESFKSTTAPTALFKTSDFGGLRLELFRDSINSDAAFVKYIDNATEEFDLYDIEKLGGSVNISTLTDAGVSLTANCKPFNGIGDTIALNVATTANGAYVFKFSGADQLVVDKSVLLFDKFTNVYVNLKNTSEYLFTVDVNNKATLGSGRFELLIGTDIIATGLTEASALSSVRIYPTLVENTLHVQQKAGADFSLIEVFDISGRTVFTQSNLNWNNGELELPLSVLQSGQYFLQLSNPQNGNREVVRFMKQ